MLYNKLTKETQCHDDESPDIESFFSFILVEVEANRKFIKIK